MTSIRRASKLFLFGGVFLAGLCVFAPASLMSYALNRATDGMLSLAQTRGSLWHGEGVALLKQKSRYQSLGDYRWRVLWLHGALQVQAGESPPMTVSVHPFSGSIGIDRLNVTLPFSIVQIAVPQLEPYQLQGTLQASSAHLTLNAAGLDGAISVDWLQAASALSEIRPLGNYHVDLQGDGAALDAKLSTQSGKLMLSATGRYDRNSGMNIDGTAQAASGVPDVELDELLHHIGPEIKPGVFKLGLMPQAAVR